MMTFQSNILFFKHQIVVQTEPPKGHGESFLRLLLRYLAKLLHFLAPLLHSLTICLCYPAIHVSISFLLCCSIMDQAHRPLLPLPGPSAAPVGVTHPHFVVCFT